MELDLGVDQQEVHKPLLQYLLYSVHHEGHKNAFKWFILQFFSDTFVRKFIKLSS